MKKLIYIVISLAFVSIALTSCVEDNNYETPQISCTEPVLTGAEDTIEELITAWQQSGDGTLFFDEDYPDYIVGYVTSNDATGNFYKELYIQNDPTNPTASIKLNINMSDLYTKYNVGRKLYIYMKGFGIGLSHGEVVIMERGDGSGVSIRPNVAKRNIIRSCDIFEITPLALTSPSVVNDSHLGMFVAFPNMQFDISLVGQDFVNELDSYDSHRPITSCDDNSNIKLETSTYADFKNVALPVDQGSVKGIIARDYGDDFYVLRVNGVDAFVFDGDRCDPDILECDNPNVGGDVVVFDENFSSYAPNTTNLPGWTNVNVSGGNTVYKVKEYSGEQYMQIGAYNTNENPLEAWLVTPAINLDNTTDEELTFKTKTGYNNGAALSVFVSTDFTGDVATATWVMINTHIANGPSSGYGNFEDSGSVDISCLDGDVYFAFKYLGGDGGVTTTFQVDDVKVTGND